MTYPSPNIKAITEFIFIGKKADALRPSNLVVILGNHIIDLMMGEVSVLYAQGKITKDATVILTGANGDMTAGQAAECDQMYEAAVKKYGMPQEGNDDGKYGPERYIEAHIWSDKVIHKYVQKYNEGLY